MNKLLIGIIILLIVGVGAFVFIPKSNTTDNTANTDNNNEQVKTFAVDSANLRFYIDGVENPDIIVNEGDKVKIEFTSTEGFHDFVLDEFNAKTERVNAPGSSSVEFTADKKGTFEYYCSVGQHRANGMKGKFIVE